MSGGRRRERKKQEIDTTCLFKRRETTYQPFVNAIFKKPEREEACKDIALFFYNNVIPFSVAKSE